MKTTVAATLKKIFLRPDMVKPKEVKETQQIETQEKALADGVVCFEDLLEPEKAEVRSESIIGFMEEYPSRIESTPIVREEKKEERNLRIRQTPIEKPLEQIVEKQPEPTVETPPVNIPEISLVDKILSSAIPVAVREAKTKFDTGLTTKQRIKRYDIANAEKKTDASAAARIRSNIRSAEGSREG